METSSYFISDLALFGPYPEQDSVEELESNGVTHFVNLTYPGEKLTRPYKVQPETKVTNFSIRDKNIPSSRYDFSKFILEMVDKLHKLKQNGKKMYVHCKGGHGRSGMVVACILIQWFKFEDPEYALKLTTEYRNNRPKIKHKYLYQTSPEMNIQKNFVRSITSPTYISNNDYIIEFFKSYPVVIDNIRYQNLIELAQKNLYLIENENAKKYYSILFKTITNLVENNREFRNTLSHPNLGMIFIYYKNSPVWDIDNNHTADTGGSLINLALLHVKNNLIINKNFI